MLSHLIPPISCVFSSDICKTMSDPLYPDQYQSNRASFPLSYYLDTTNRFHLIAKEAFKSMLFFLLELLDPPHLPLQKIT